MFVSPPSIVAYFPPDEKCRLLETGTYPFDPKGVK